MPRRTPRNALDRLRTPRRFPKFLKTAAICILVGGLFTPISQAAAADSAAGADTRGAAPPRGGEWEVIHPPG
ncbi:hypothetical protein ACFTY7_10740, partial [Streptomyces sp. NPDC057062]|uniref:hypothetical protein n=1 Tax=Streptomyces sp. NPDC057062 TaxID=3346011 RepID=UPI0036370CC0